MAFEKSTRRMTLRDLLVHVEKLSRDVAQYFRIDFWQSLNEFHDISRPVRRRSHYPTLLVVNNSLEQVQATGKELTEMTDYLEERLKEILEHAKREQARRF